MHNASSFAIIILKGGDYMSIHKDSMNLLKEIYSACNEYQAYNITRETFDSWPADQRIKIENQINYLKDSNLIKNFAPCSGLPISVSITPEGIRTVEGVLDSNNSTSSTTNIYGPNYGIVGNNNAGNSISNNFSFQDVQKIISDCAANPEEAELLELELKKLYDRIDMEVPVEKGLLSKISDLLQKHQVLANTVITSLLNYLTTAPK